MEPTLALIAQNSQGGGLFGILILVIPLAALMYLMIVPQRRQRQRHAEFVNKLDVGDEVVTAGGMYGIITFIEDDVAHVEVDTDVVIRVSISSIARSASDPDPDDRGARANRAPAGRDDDADETEPGDEEQ